jgi:hypothetical protein
VPTAGFDEKTVFLGQHLHDHVAAAASNLMGANKPFLERSVQYNALSLESIAVLAKQSERLGMTALLALNKSAMNLEHADAISTQPRQRMTFGIYFYAEPTSPSNTS